jgi:RNA polymerase sigma factor (sigma-70 family)
MSYIEIKKTYPKKIWMSLEDEFEKEGRNKKECPRYRREIFNQDRQELYNELKHHECCESYDAHEEESDECGHAGRKTISRDAVDYRAIEFSINPRKSPEDIVIDILIRDELLKAISMLSDAHRDIIIAIYYGNLNFAECGRLFDKSGQWASQLHQTAIKKLRKIIEVHFPKSFEGVY